jgi:limonene-1,2-epoxide hydrolase
VNSAVMATRFHRFFAAFDANDVKSLDRLITDDIQLRLGNAPTVHGKAAFFDALNTLFSSIGGVEHEILNVYRDGAVAIVEYDVHYTRLDGKIVTLPCCNVFRLPDGLIAEYRSYIDATPVYAETTED